MSWSPESAGFTLEMPQSLSPELIIYRDTALVSKFFDLSIPAFVNCCLVLPAP